ncbi:MAG TPA: hypothetical protein VFS91_11525, partial [Nitrobacter sp.]|nr:hypothetical protein [Nitrobacter sp.]
MRRKTTQNIVCEHRRCPLLRAPASLYPAEKITGEDLMNRYSRLTLAALLSSVALPAFAQQADS